VAVDLFAHPVETDGSDMVLPTGVLAPADLNPETIQIGGVVSDE
jgi:hypothetical protein